VDRVQLAVAVLMSLQVMAWQHLVVACALPLVPLRVQAAVCASTQVETCVLPLVMRLLAATARVDLCRCAVELVHLVVLWLLVQQTAMTAVAAMWP
jgi:hypothetical protein